MFRGNARKINLTKILMTACVAFAVALASTGTALAALDTSWSGSGTGTTTVVSNGSVSPAIFKYEHQVSCCASGSWNFSAVAATSRTVVLKYKYEGYHAWYQVRVNLNAFVGQSSVPLVAAGPVSCCAGPPSGGFSYTGTVTLSVSAGQSYGFTMSGSNGDSDGRFLEPSQWPNPMTIRHSRIRWPGPPATRIW